ncbi:hypothetical protein ACFXMT_08560 [Streptomyces mirabilis]|uniref:hypothetical protein n=1 Tax=Streptomyces mirabilis TaxID=68239 RepID=UPI00369628EB
MAEIPRRPHAQRAEPGKRGLGRHRRPGAGAARGRVPVLEASAAEIRATYDVETRTVALDLSAPGALSELTRATFDLEVDLEVGLFVYNAGGDDRSVAFLDKDLGSHLELVHRNCLGPLEAAYRFGGPMVARGRGPWCW